MSQGNNGLGQLDGMRDKARERRSRQAPESRHPRPEVPPASFIHVEEPPKPTEGAPKAPVQKTAEPAVFVSSADDTTTMQVTAYITAETLAAVRRIRSAQAPGSYVALRAISVMKERLGELIEARHNGNVKRPVDDFMFPPRRGAAAGKGEARRMWVIRLTPAELEVVDSLAAKFSASRSELISVAVEAYVTTN